MIFFEFARFLFVPHHTNNHRPKVLHIDALFFYVLFFAMLHLGIRSVNRTMPDVLGYATDIHTEQLLSSTNSQRKSLGLTPLTLNSKLSAAAARKAQDMFANNYWAHNSPTGKTPWDFVRGAGYSYTVAGENLAKNFSTSQAVVDAWMASPTHRENIVKPGYKEMGFAIVNGVLNGEETTLVVQMFGASTAPKVVALATPATVAPIVQKALAAEEVVVEEIVPEPVISVTPAPIVPLYSSAATESMTTAFLGVSKKPAINIPTLMREIVYVFAGVLLGVLLLDAWMVSKKKIVRVAGHNIGHFLFLSAVVIAVSSLSRGALL